RGSIPPAPGGHRLGLGLPGYLILFAPPAFVLQRQVKRPGRCLRRRCSSGSLRISPLHPEFHAPLRPSSRTVWEAPSRVSREISPPTRTAAYAPFTPSNSGQRSPPTYYRGCWHVVSRGFFLGYRPSGLPPRLVPQKSGLRPEGRPPARGVARSGLPPLP